MSKQKSADIAFLCVFLRLTIPGVLHEIDTANAHWKKMFGIDDNPFYRKGNRVFCRFGGLEIGEEVNYGDDQ